LKISFQDANKLRENYVSEKELALMHDHRSEIEKKRGERADLYEICQDIVDASDWKCDYDATGMNVISCLTSSLTLTEESKKRKI
jgi:hypothetical protein